MNIREFLTYLDEYGILANQVTVDKEYCSEDIEICLRGLEIELDDRI